MIALERLALGVLALPLLLDFASGSSVGSCPNRTLVLPRYTEYARHCENTFASFDFRWPCMSHKSGNLHNVRISHLGWDHKPERVLLPKNGDLVGEHMPFSTGRRLSKEEHEY